MKSKTFCFIFILSAWSCIPSKQDQTSREGNISAWITTGDRTSLLAEASTKLTFDSVTTASNAIIEVDTTQRFQTIDGFGYALTGGSAYLINQKLTAGKREELLKELFLTDSN